jgi:glycosyltransferase 2 family protein
LFYRFQKMVGAFGARFGWNWIGFALSITIVGISLHVLAGMLQDIDLARVAASVRAMPPADVAAAALFIACAYGTLTCYDLFASTVLRSTRRPR